MAVDALLMPAAAGKVKEIFEGNENAPPVRSSDPRFPRRRIHAGRHDRRKYSPPKLVNGAEPGDLPLPVTHQILSSFTPCASSASLRSAGIIGCWTGSRLNDRDLESSNGSYCVEVRGPAFVTCSNGLQRTLTPDRSLRSHCPCRAWRRRELWRRHRRNNRRN